MKVQMLVATFYEQVLNPYDETDVPDEVAHRWQNNGIATIVVEPVVEEEVNYADMSTKDLYKLCISKGLEVEPKQQKEVYLAALEDEGNVE